MGTRKRNRCPRCGGLLFLDSDMDGWYEQCLNCSYRNDLKVSVDAAVLEAVRAMKEKPSRI